MRIHPAVVCMPVLLSIACAATPGFDAEAEAAALRARSEALAAAESAQDAEASASFWSEDAIVQAAGAPQIKGRAAILDMYRSYFSSGTIKEFTPAIVHQEIAASGDFAYEYGTNHFVLSTPGGDVVDDGKYMAVWRKIDGEWYAIACSFSSDAAAPKPIAAQ